MDLKETELCLGLPGAAEPDQTPRPNGKRGFSETHVDLKLNFQSNKEDLTNIDTNNDQEAANNKEKNLLSSSTKDDPAKPPPK